MSYRKEIRRLFDLQKFGFKFGLEGITALLARLGDPHRGLKCVHLAGTNGKGSVGVMLKTALDRAGRRVGFYTSPHLATFRERIVVGEELIPEDDVLRLSERVWKITDSASPPTFFEFVTAMAFLYFQEKEVEVAIVEAGLGGRLDSTNVVDPLAAVITNVSLEHTEHLGSTVAAIAAEKAGIIKPGRPTITGRLAPEAAEIIARTTAEKNSPWQAWGRNFTAEALGGPARPAISFRQGERRWENMNLALAGAHQTENAAVVLALAPHLEAAGLPASEAHFRAGLAEARWPGRAETWAPGSWPPEGPRALAPLLLDGAHNPAGAAALAAHLAALKPRRLHLLAGVMADKDMVGVLGPLLKAADRLYLTRPRFSRAAPPELLRDKLAAAFNPLPPFSLHAALEEALAAAAAEAEAADLAVVCGSLFTVGETLAYLNGWGEVESN